MSGNTYKEESLEKINHILKYILENKYSSFYIDKYSGNAREQIDSYEDFKDIPFLSKDEILAKRVQERIFIPDDRVTRYTFSSGTTNNRRPMITPHMPKKSGSSAPSSYNEEEMKRVGAKRIIIFMRPMADGYIQVLSRPKKYTQAVPGDVTNIPLTARIISDLGIDGITSTPTLLFALIEELEKTDFDLSSIKWISLGSEFTTKQKLEYFKSKLPNAFINFRYGNSEFGNIRGYRCEHLAKTAGPGVFHPTPFALIEIADEAGNILDFGNDGEIVHTDLEETAFPLVRYRTGDIGRLERKPCICGHEYVLHLGGKQSLDFLRLYGTILHVQAIEDSLDDSREFIEPKFRMHVWEKKSEGRLRPSLTLELQLKKGYRHLSGDKAFADELKEKISNRLKLSSTSTLKQLVEKNVFVPLELTFVSFSADITKAKNIISHL